MKLYYYLPALLMTARRPVAVRSFNTSFFRRPSLVFTPETLFRTDLLKPSKELATSVPRYEITNTDENFQIALDIPGVKADDISVTLEDNGRVLTLKGESKEEKENYYFSSKFYQSFTLDPAIDTSKITANLDKGVLVVSAPKDMKRVEEGVKRIAITSVPHKEETKVEAKKEDEPVATK
jgi:HSP20 family protein